MTRTSNFSVLSRESCLFRLGADHGVTVVPSWQLRPTIDGQRRIRNV